MTAAVGGHLAAAARSDAVWWGFVGAGWLPVFAMIFSAAIHTPAASVYTNYAAAAQNERHIAPAFLAAGAIAALMPMLAGLIAILTTARYGNRHGAQRLPEPDDARLRESAPSWAASPWPRSWPPSSRRAARSCSRARRCSCATGCRSRASTTRRNGSGPTGSRRSSTPSWPRWPPGWSPRRPTSRSSTCCCSASRWWCRRRSPSATSSTGAAPRSGGAYWGMAIGYGAGLVWFALIKLAVAAGLTAPEGASALYRLAVNSLTVNGEGLDPSYVTTLVPLVAVPAISLLTSDATDGDGRRRRQLLRHAGRRAARRPRGRVGGARRGGAARSPGAGRGWPEAAPPRPARWRRWRTAMSGTGPAAW